MLARDVVRTRLEAGISYTEFSYVLLQAMDYLNLHRDYGVTLQFGGSDQWGNLTGGVELVRRAEGTKVHAFATPLITRSDGRKYGKTESGALWLDPGTLGAALHEAGATRLDRSDGMPTIADLFVASGLSKSKGDARRTVAEGGAYLNNVRVEDADYVPGETDLLGGSLLVLRRGKKHLAGVEVA